MKASKTKYAIGLFYSGNCKNCKRACSINDRQANFEINEDDCINLLTRE